MSYGDLFRRTLARLLAPVVIASAVVAVYFAFWQVDRSPRTDVAEVDAPTVAIAASVPGKVISVDVHNNASVKKGDVLFRLDPEPYRLRLEQARAELRAAQSEVAQGERNLDLERANADVADRQIARARNNARLARQTQERLEPLLPKRFVTEQQVAEARTAAADAEVSLAQALQSAHGANRVVGTLDTRKAQADVARATVALAERDLENTVVRAPFDGKIVGLRMVVGKVVVPAETLFTLIDTAEWEIVAFFRETELKAIGVGSRADVFVMADPERRISGTVVGVGWGVRSEESATILGIPIVSNSLNWVKVAKRFPVHVRLEGPPEDLMRVGASAVVTIGPTRNDADAGQAAK
ncbi:MULTISPECIES: multidrug transporter subunit MdtN [unclassified Ensifer]|uniref:multidrug transporter subunit MdtN n=1 Tax=unclassified Ensifer TaxID=2633371 RepID=UPI0008133A1E|nr:MULTISPECIES: multidrug transporter subunit MdtN [unclassified Ensifer]OCP02722.1 multidrug transporter subunit MdtN [Ensifer sp. LC14]OCP13623.1 multidrug transporter subunit MdtN [Ensifer sp. LC13]OCP14283.1 multidrug transporter subunit MdtN [Ensifer sp. LC11]OCP28986.1 multidrug transporter subunit MdtN [Ensifer sp. LC499]